MNVSQPDRYDSEIERAFLRAMVERVRTSVVANFLGVAILCYVAFVASFGRALAIGIALRVVAISITAFNTRRIVAALEHDRPVTREVNNTAYGMAFAGLTWGVLLWFVPPDGSGGLSATLVAGVVITGVAMISATASPVPRVMWAFLVGFSISVSAWLVKMTIEVGFEPVASVLAIGAAVVACSSGLTRESQSAARLIVENRQLADQLGALNAVLESAVAEKEHLACHDLLTALPNRRAFLDRTGAILEAGDEQSWAAILIDLDHFKQVNDKAGHAGGDHVLRATGALLASMVDALPDKAIAARLGGEEFVLLVRGLDDPGVRDLAVSIGARFRIVPSPAGYDGRISASMGLARWLPGEAIDRCLQRADEALYQAKAAGRDRAVMADCPFAVAARSEADAIIAADAKLRAAG
ncbi:sensor domain-containing diguanylate cyclase [Sphingomicrobium nitratireducens]|uniref:GGDEF domain-containing protein n=1 Tax=Sphingomicrobium nitratireducens TaxID=2964666 RepID=UPI00224087EC|nr:diguanylate cyclase [Sphingomicrobium nitratireducens]